jgi:SAM-dependent methyltransferase
MRPATGAQGMDKPDEQQKLQLDFYARQATGYVSEPFGQGEVDAALPFVIGQIQMRGWNSLLDIGSGSGRILAMLRQHAPLQRIAGVEPSREMRQIAYERFGFKPFEFLDGDATRLPFADNEFDVVTEFAVLHHVRHPRRAMAEMIRVARHAVILADSNNFGQGGLLSRRIKQTLNALRLWPVVDFLRTRGKGYHVSEGDGLWYSYSVFNDFDLLEGSFNAIHTVNVSGTAVDHYRDSVGALILAIDKKS